MAKIDNIDIGTVTGADQYTVEKHVKYNPTQSGTTYLGTLDSDERQWLITGFLIDPSQESTESLEHLANQKKIVFIDCEDIDLRLLGWGWVTALRVIREDREAGVVYYEINFGMAAAIGTTRLISPTTNLVVLIDKLYRSKMLAFDPQFGRFFRSWSSNRLSFSYEFYISNYTNGPSTNAIVEIECGDDLSYIEVYGWKNSAWSLIGKWGSGGTGWGVDGSVWTDEDSISHTPRANIGNRGDTKPMAVISTTLGCEKRVLFRLTNFTNGASSHVYNKYGNYQVYLKVNLVHITRDALRPLPVITYVSGGYDMGVP